MKRPPNPALERLRHHITGAIERGEVTPIVAAVLPERDLILAALAAFVRSRPGFEPGSYGTRADYARDVRHATQQLHDAQAMLSAIGWRQSIDADALRAAFSAFSGRLTWRYTPGEGTGRWGMVEYCTGQYYCTEFRAAVCAVLARALWNYWRTGLLATYEDGSAYAPRDLILARAKKELPRGVFTRWFKES